MCDNMKNFYGKKKLKGICVENDQRRIFEII